MRNGTCGVISRLKNTKKTVEKYRKNQNSIHDGYFFTLGLLVFYLVFYPVSLYIFQTFSNESLCLSREQLKEFMPRTAADGRCVSAGFVMSYTRLRLDSSHGPLPCRQQGQDPGGGTGTPVIAGSGPGHCRDLGELSRLHVPGQGQDVTSQGPKSLGPSSCLVGDGGDTHRAAGPHLPST